MAAYLMIRVELPNADLTQTSQKLVDDDTKPHEGVQAVKQILEDLIAGVQDGTVVIATRDSTQAITATGTGNMGASYSLA